MIAVRFANAAPAIDGLRQSLQAAAAAFKPPRRMRILPKTPRQRLAERRRRRLKP